MKVKNRTELAKKFHGYGVELGVAQGDFTKTIIYHGHALSLWAIDRWAGDRGHGDGQYIKCLKEIKMTDYHRYVHFIRLPFDKAIEIFPDDFLNFIYIDGYAHNGQENGQTLRDWWPKLKKGGIFSGHDYHEQFPLTIQAVDEFARDYNFKYQITEEQPVQGTKPLEFPSWWGVK